MFSTIVHIADIHLPKSPARHEEYKQVFNNLYNSLWEKKPSRIVICGDINNDYVDFQSEQLILVSEFLNTLATIAPIRITRGNHDFLRKSPHRTDSIEALVATIKNDNIIYYKETGFYDDENITWAVWKHGEANNSPWAKFKKYKRKEGQIYIDLFHDPIQGAKAATGFEFKTKQYYKISDFKGSYSYLGDLHLLQFFGKGNSIAYPSSLISQNFGEGDKKFHGYLFWNIINKEVEEVSIHNDWSFKTVVINQFTDFDELDIDIPDSTKNIRLRIIWRTLPATRTKDNERKVVTHLKEKYNIISIKNKNEFIEGDSIDVSKEQLKIDNIQTQEIQHEIFRKHLEKIGIPEDEILEVIKTDDEITAMIDSEEFTHIQWDVVKLSGRNFKSYEELNIDWTDKEGLYQITGKNGNGKTSIFALITYILYGKTLETESRVEFGDVRYVNNRNGAAFCEGRIVICVNGEYYGIIRRTDVTRDRNGEINGSPTQVMYYKLTDVNDEFTNENSIVSLGEDARRKTEQSINKAIGSYKNFMRVVMTTSDTLNLILSNQKAEFIDSILYDSGLDIFDKKLTAFKKYQKNIMSKPRVSCNVERSEEEINQINIEIVKLNEDIDILETHSIPEVKDRIDKGKSYIENLTKKLYKIDPEIYNLDINQTNRTIEIYNRQIADHNQKLEQINKSISELKESYDEEKLNKLLEQKEQEKQQINDLKIKIKENEQFKYNKQHDIEMIRGDIKRLKERGKEKKDEIEKIKKSDICPTCGQEIKNEEHKKHIADKIKELENEMYNVIAPTIVLKENSIPEIEKIINYYISEINLCKKDITEIDLNSEKLLNEIGILTNDKNDVEKRKVFLGQKELIPIQIENIQLKINTLNDKIIQHENSKKQIEENNKIEKAIDLSKTKLNELDIELDDLKVNTYNKKTAISQNVTKINDLNKLIILFKEQERNDRILNIYQNCVHRDGIPTQLLITYAIPKINIELTNLLDEVPFKIWLDSDELKLKLAYNNRLDAVIDAISASGMERTFSSVALKFALNQINAKSKPTILLLDEITGKLVDESVDNFISILNAIKLKMKLIFIVEHNHEISPNYIIDVQKNEDDISSLTIN